jgi:multiple sugar transport system permease protein
LANVSPTSAGAPAAGRARSSPLGSRLGFQHWALAPLLLFLVLFAFYPVAELARMAFSTTDPSGGDFGWQFSGLDNLRAMLRDDVFGAALRNTLLFVVAATLLQLVLGTALALLVERSRWFSGLARNVLVWPALVTPVAISVTWWLILNPEFGLLNHASTVLGLPTQAWLASTRWALPTLVLVDVWHWTPLVFLIVLAGLSSIDRTLYEAAQTDGTSGWRTFWSITLPLLAPTLLVAAVIRTVLGFKVFDEIYLLTGGGPGTATEVVSTRVADVFLGQLDMGYGAFLGLVIVAVLILLVLALSRVGNLFGGAG